MEAVRRVSHEQARLRVLPGKPGRSEETDGRSAARVARPGAAVDDWVFQEMTANFRTRLALILICSTSLTAAEVTTRDSVSNDSAIIIPLSDFEREVAMRPRSEKVADLKWDSARLERDCRTMLLR